MHSAEKEDSYGSCDAYDIEPSMAITPDSKGSSRSIACRNDDFPVHEKTYIDFCS